LYTTALFVFLHIQFILHGMVFRREALAEKVEVVAIAAEAAVEVVDLIAIAAVAQVATAAAAVDTTDTNPAFTRNCKVWQPCQTFSFIPELLNMNILSSPAAGCMRWGKWGLNFTTAEYRQMIDSCLEAGINSFDHADIYGHYTTEEEFGTALNEAPHLRNRMKLITKCGIKLVSPNREAHQIKSYDTSYTHIIESVEQSLKNFRTDYIDVLLIHRPDVLLKPEEVAKAIDQLKHQGKIHHFGVSNFLPHQVNTLYRYAVIEFNQVEVSLIQMSAFTNGILDNCIEHKITPLAWAPLGGGLLSDEIDEKNFRIAAAAKIIAEKYDTGINSILIAWLLMHPSNIIPVIGSTKIERLQQAQEANEIKLTCEEWYMLWRASTGEDVA
jgi:predicted oxidoreductase